jgi:predicted nucleic acid-binding protein
METVYIETTIVSYLVANPSRDLILAAHQEATREWWNEQRPRYHCVASDEVIREASLGDPAMSRRRLEALAGMTVLRVTEEVRLLAKDLLAQQILAPAVIADALHTATASIHEADYLLTWNCRHLAMANPHLQKPLRSFMAAHGLTLPDICTPIELAEYGSHESESHSR